MRDGKYQTVNRAEYNVIQATLPLVAEFHCRNEGGASFTKFWKLPAEIHSQMETYRPPTHSGNQNWIDSFKLYRTGSERVMLLAITHPEEFEDWTFECLGEYLSLVKKFVVTPHPVSDAMLAEMQTRSTAQWSWTEFKANADGFSFFAGIILTCFMLFLIWRETEPPWDLLSSDLGLLLTIPIVLGASGIFLLGPLVLAGSTIDAWRKFKKKRASFARMLNSYLAAKQAIPLG